jgi:cytochrome P450
MSDKQPLPTGTQLSALDPTFRERPHEYLDRLRSEEPVHRDTELGRLFLTRFEDVRSVLSNRSLSVDPRKAPPGSFFRRILAANEPLASFEPSMLQLDDPDHKRIRGLVSQAFNQRAVDAVRPRIRAIADGLLDTLGGRDSFDIIAEYAAPLPIIVIAEVLGSTLAILCSSSAGRMRDRRSSTLLGPRSRRPSWSWRGRAFMIISLGQ